MWNTITPAQAATVARLIDHYAEFGVRNTRFLTSPAWNNHAQFIVVVNGDVRANFMINPSGMKSPQGRQQLTFTWEELREDF